MTPSKSSPLSIGTERIVRTFSIFFEHVRIFRISQDIGNVDRLAFKRRTARSAVSAWANWVLGDKVLELLRSVEGHYHPQQLAIEPVNERSVSPTQPDRAFGDGFKHRLKIKRRAADDLEHLRRGRLLLQ